MSEKNKSYHFVLCIVSRFVIWVCKYFSWNKSRNYFRDISKWS